MLIALSIGVEQMNVLQKTTVVGRKIEIGIGIGIEMGLKQKPVAQYRWR
jgi:hypothetical protein